MKTAGTLSERELITQFVDALRALPDVRAEYKTEALVAPGRRCDAWVDISVAGQNLSIVVEAKKTSYPRDVRQMLWQLREIVRSAKPQASRVVPFLVAESISPGAKELLRNEQIGYFDSGGSLFLSTPGLHINVDRPPSKRFARSIRSLFSGRRGQVLHALLSEHPNRHRVHELAANAKVSPATASEVLIELERLEWVRSRGLGPHKQRWLDEPSKLLDAWVEELPRMRRSSIHRYFVPLIQTGDLIEKLAAVLAAHRVDYAITGEAAGQRYAPFLSGLSRVHCRLRVSPAVDEAIAGLGARPVDSGTNLVVIESRPPGDFLFREERDEIQFASPIQVYLDLLCSGGRAKELAHHLRSEVIKF